MSRRTTTAEYYFTATSKWHLSKAVSFSSVDVHRFHIQINVSSHALFSDSLVIGPVKAKRI